MSEERHEIEVRLKGGWSIYHIAKHLGRPYNAIKNEISRGTVSLYHGKLQRYKADERKTHTYLWIKARDHSAQSANEALRRLFSSFGDMWHEVFKTITADNDSKFALLSELEDEDLKVYFTHPYTSCVKGTNGCHNRMLRRFIPKGRSIADYFADDLCFFADCINCLPRKILGYATPEALLDEQLDRIYTS